ncbi:MAG TPA: ferritin [Polyangiaceae bacterium]|nr:ferritin [Polyangiaceae bacterium]
MSEYHEPVAELDDETRDLHRALTSVKEEFEAADWYQQRLTSCKDPDLKRILTHNRDEEFEHASMLVEWLRRRKPSFAERLAKIAFTDRTLGVELPDTGPAKGAAGALGADAGRGLGVGSLKGHKS